MDVLTSALASLAAADAARPAGAPALLRGALDARAAGGATPLHLAATGNHGAAVAALLASGARTDAGDGCGRLPLHTAAAARGGAALALLLAAPDAAPDARTQDGVAVTALHLSAADGWRPGVRALLSAGADPCARTARRWPPSSACNPGSTPLHCAAACGKTGACQAVLEGVTARRGGPRGATGARRAWEGDAAVDPRSAADAAGNLPYHAAWAAGHADLSSALNPGASVDAARERGARVPGAVGAMPLAALAAYAVRDGLLKWLGVDGEEEEEEGDCAASVDAASTPSSYSSSSHHHCGICFEPAPRTTATAPCGHALCAPCARGLTAADARPPRCPFCRADVLAWVLEGQTG